MKRSRSSYRGYPNWRQRNSRGLIWALVVGGVAAAVMVVLIYLSNRTGRLF